MAEGQNRTYPASARRLQKAREEGDVVLSREVASFFSTGLPCIILGVLEPSLLDHSVAVLERIIAGAHNHQMTEGGGGKLALTTALELATPLLLLAAVGGSFATLIQTRFLVRPAALKWDFARLNPVKGAKRLFGVDGLIELGKSVVKLLLMLSVMSYVLVEHLHLFTSVIWADPRTLAKGTAHLGGRVLIAAGLVQGVVAILDYFTVRFRFVARHRMSREDLKDEFKETEGNPHTKSRIKRLLRVKRRPLKRAVQTATVVITNPTHYAVALFYDRATSAAPKVAAKGADLVAQRIRELARANDVPIVESPALARALFLVDWDTDIPPEHYKAVAEIVAFVWRIRGGLKRR